MKSYNNLYDKMLDRSYIEECFFKASKGKRRRRDVADILDPAHLPKHVERVHDMMESESFVPGNHEIAIINESSSRKNAQDRQTELRIRAGHPSHVCRTVLSGRDAWLL